MGACTSSEGVHPDHDDLPGQQYLGRCWKLLSTEDPAWLESVPAWSRTSNGELPSRGFHFVLATDPTTKAPIRTPYFNKATKKVNGYYAPGLTCDFDGLENNTQVFADSDIKTSTKTSLSFSLGVGLGTAEASVGAQRKEKHGTGESDYYVVVTIETYRLSVDLSRMFYASADGEPFGASERNFAASSSGAQDPAPAPSSSSPSSPPQMQQETQQHAKFIRHSIDHHDSDAYGHGCVTQVKCGGQLLIRIKQTNYGDQLKAWGASISAGIRAGVPTVGASGNKKKKGGDLRLNVEVHHAGGPDVPTSFQNCTLDDIESMVETWSKGLVNNVLLAVPLRVGVHRYNELKGQLSFSPLHTSPRSFQTASLQEENAELRERIATLERQIELQQPSLVSAPDPNDATVRQSSDTSFAAAAPIPPAASSTDNVVAEVVVPSLPGESSSVAKNRLAVAGYIGRCVTGQICEIDFSQVPDPEEAALWAAMALHRYPCVVKSIRLSGCRARDRAAMNLAAVLRVAAPEQVLCRIDVTDNAIAVDGAVELVEAAIARVQRGGSTVDVYLDNNEGLAEAAASHAQFAAALREASRRGINVSL